MRTEWIALVIITDSLKRVDY